MKKIIILGLLLLCLAGGWLITLTSALKKDDTPERVAAYRQLAEEQMNLGGYGLAVDCYSAIVKLDDTPDNRLALANACRLADYTAEFKKTLEKMICDYPEDSRGYEMLADYYDAAVDHGDCIEVVKRATAAGVSTQHLNDLYYEHAFVFSYLKGSYSSASSMRAGTGAVSSDQLWGILDRAGNLIGSTLYQKASNFIEDYAAAADGEHYGFITRDGSWYFVMEEPFDRAFSISQGLGVVFRDGTAVYVNQIGQIQLGPYEDATGFSNDIAAVKENNLWHLIGKTGKTIGDGGYLDVLQDEDGLCSVADVVFVRDQNGWRLIDREGAPCSDLYFDEVRPFYEKSYAAVCLDGMWGFVGVDGNWALEPRFDAVDSFSCGLAAVRENGLWGYIDNRMVMAIEPQFEEAGPFASCKVAPVKKEGSWRYIKLLV